MGSTCTVESKVLRIKHILYCTSPQDPAGIGLSRSSGESKCRGLAQEDKTPKEVRVHAPIYCVHFIRISIHVNITHFRLVCLYANVFSFPDLYLPVAL